jgi:hypothetical protein
MEELAARAEHHFRFSGTELLRLLTTVIVGAFVLSFRKWGVETFDVVTGITNFIVIAIILFICLFIHFAVQKMVALHFGYQSEYKNWHNGFLLSIIVCFFSFGYIPLFFTGVLSFDIIPKLRVGTFRGGVMQKDLAIIAVAGPFINLLLVGILAPFYIATKSNLIFTMIVINLLIAIFALLPIPTFEKVRQFKGGTTGLYLFIESRWIYVLVFVTVLSFAGLILIAQVFSYIIALVLGALVALIYHNTYEST